MGAGHGVHVERFAAGGSLTLECAAVPGCFSELSPVMTGRGCGRCVRRIRSGGIMLS